MWQKGPRGKPRLIGSKLWSGKISWKRTWTGWKEPLARMLLNCTLCSSPSCSGCSLARNAPTAILYADTSGLYRTVSDGSYLRSLVVSHFGHPFLSSYPRMSFLLSASIAISQKISKKPKIFWIWGEALQSDCHLRDCFYWFFNRYQLASAWRRLIIILKMIITSTIVRNICCNVCYKLQISMDFNYPYLE